MVKNKFRNAIIGLARASKSVVSHRRRLLAKGTMMMASLRIFFNLFAKDLLKNFLNEMTR